MGWWSWLLVILFELHLILFNIKFLNINNLGTGNFNSQRCVNSMNNYKSNLNIENIEFKSDGITLRGRLITPEENVTLPVLIMTHGSSAT